MLPHGLASTQGAATPPHCWRVLQNVALFRDHSPILASGLEVNWAYRRGLRREELTITPQLHYHLTPNWNVQFGIGASRIADSSWDTIYTFRLIWER